MKDPGNEVVSDKGLLLFLRFVQKCSKVISKSHNRVIMFAIEVSYIDLSKVLLAYRYLLWCNVFACCSQIKMKKKYSRFVLANMYCYASRKELVGNFKQPRHAQRTCW